MAWKYYKKGKLVKECDNIPEDIDKIVGFDWGLVRRIEERLTLLETEWSNYREIPETMDDAVRELRENGVDVSDCIVEVDDCWSPDYPPEEREEWIKDDMLVKPLTDDEKEHGVELKSNNWWNKWTTGEKQYLSFWIIYLYLLLGLVITQEPKIVGMVAEIILWPLFM